MELGLNGRNALLLASSRGLGKACAEAIAREGANVTINGRNADDVDQTAEALQMFGTTVTKVVADATTAEGRAALLEACPEPDILLLNGAGPPPTKFTKITPQQWETAVNGTMISPLLLVGSVLDGMIERQFGRIVAITSAMVKTPRSIMTLSIGPRTGLTASLKAISREVAEHNVTINQILPERIDTGRQQEMAQMAVERQGITLEQALADIADTIAAKRLGRPNEVGDAFAYLCSDQASFISGQNLQLDGGSYPGLI